MPSYYESFGMVALEAMACGTPVLASRVGGLQTLIRDGQTGYLVPWRCPEAFTERMELLLGNEALRNELGSAGHAAAQAYRWDQIAKRTADLYEAVIQEHELRLHVAGDEHPAGALA
jgi:D-inositol-3-phosphate glycosyltransferase